MSMWCMLAAPLLAGNDLTKMTPYVKSVLIHEGLIAIDQDPLVSQAVVAKEGGRNTSKLDQGWQIWKRPLHDGTKAALLLNRGATNLSITLEFSDVGISGSPAKIHDVWAREDLSLPSGAARFTAVVPAHGSLTLKLTPAAVATATGGVLCVFATVCARSGKAGRASHGRMFNWTAHSIRALPASIVWLRVTISTAGAAAKRITWLDLQVPPPGSTRGLRGGAGWWRRHVQHAWGGVHVG